MGVHTDLSGLRTVSPTLWAIIGAAVALQLILAVVALWTLHHTPDDRLRHCSRTTWMVVIVLANIAGPVAFFTAGRRCYSVGGTGRIEHGSSKTRETIDRLYGEGER